MRKLDSRHCLPFLKALSDRTRWQIVQALLAEPLTVGELVERLSATQYNISKHLRILRNTGIIQTSRQGRQVRCRIVPVFRRNLGSKRNMLDLGCCSFRFDKCC